MRQVRGRKINVLKYREIQNQFSSLSYMCMARGMTELICWIDIYPSEAINRNFVHKVDKKIAFTSIQKQQTPVYPAVQTFTVD